MRIRGSTAVHALVCLAGQAALALPAAAHPHIFVDTGIDVIFDDAGRATALRITWTYDEDYSLGIVRERGVDPDGDGEATPAENASLRGFDMHWGPGASGDTYALAGETPLTLGPPRDWTAAYHAGRLVSTQVRDITPPVDPARTMLIVQVYDPGFYTAYSIASDPVLTGRQGCTAEVFAADGPDERDRQLQSALAEHGEAEDPEVQFPALGAAYADEVRVICADPSCPPGRAPGAACAKPVRPRPLYARRSALPARRMRTPGGTPSLPSSPSTCGSA